ncbi:MAG: hypothetical protein FJ271_11860 [Planctomycetes bacterium]|nr:hypothetical protein [Planctomycetota bacterium]
MPQNRHQRNRTQARERLNRFRRTCGVVAWPTPPRRQQRGIPPRCVVSVNRLRRSPGWVSVLPPRREAIPHPERLPPCSISAVNRVPPPGRARSAWFFTRPGREGQGMPVVGRRLLLWMNAVNRPALSARCDSHVALFMTTEQRRHLTMQHAATLPLNMDYQPRLNLVSQRHG